MRLDLRVVGRQRQPVLPRGATQQEPQCGGNRAIGETGKRGGGRHDIPDAGYLRHGYQQRGLALGASKRAHMGADAPQTVGVLTTIAGKRAVNVEPLPNSLMTVTSPPIIWQILRVIARPSPVPPYLRVVEASAWEKA